MKKIYKIAQELKESNEALVVAAEAIKALYIVHLHNHWETSGPNFYADHLMYQRLYEAAKTDLDALAERIIGTNSGSMKLEPKLIEVLSRMLIEIATETDPLSRAVKAETLVKQAIEDAAKTVDGLGWEDLLPSLVSNRETAIYLLKQRAQA